MDRLAEMRQEHVRLAREQEELMHQIQELIAQNAEARTCAECERERFRQERENGPSIKYV